MDNRYKLVESASTGNFFAYGKNVRTRDDCRDASTELLKWHCNFPFTFSIDYQQGSLWPLEMRIVVVVSMAKLAVHMYKCWLTIDVYKVRRLTV